jgi:type I restriction enzyme, R subunit
MSIGQSERTTQERIIQLFHEELEYDYLGNWSDRDNSNIEESLLSRYLNGRGYTSVQISRVLDRLRTEALNPNRSLYDNNKAVYSLLRYGVQVQASVGEQTQTVRLIDWNNATNNDFAIAEEVTLRGNYERRPTSSSMSTGSLSGCWNSKTAVKVSGKVSAKISRTKALSLMNGFLAPCSLFSPVTTRRGYSMALSVQRRKYFLKWKEDESENSRFKLDKYLLKMCNKERLIELMHDFVLFDGGVKKLPRVHQYMGIKLAQDHVHRREGGIIWHTQGSGKSIVMVLLAKWILENKPNARVVIVTDRDELDKQIEGVFRDADHHMSRATSGRDLMKQLSSPTPRLLCSLVHKFGRKGVDDFEQFISELASQPSISVVRFSYSSMSVTVPKAVNSTER